MPVAPIITGTIVHFRFHIRCMSIHKLLYFNFFIIIIIMFGIPMRLLSSLFSYTKSGMRVTNVE